MAKYRIFIVIMVMMVIIIAVMFIYDRTEFVRLKDRREAIAQMILNEEIMVGRHGSIVLPKNMKSLSDSGECFLVKFENNNAIYFYKYRGILESSKGYIFADDDLNTLNNAECANLDFVNITEICDNWYSCSTD